MTPRFAALFAPSGDRRIGDPGGESMAEQTIAGALVLGVTEGLTEFLPVSSTAHLLLLERVIGFSSKGKTFEVLIQLGAILAILAVYFAKLWSLLLALPRDARARRFVAGIVLAFLPAAAAGVALHGFIKDVLFDSPLLICTMLVLGGVALLALDRMMLQPRHADVLDYPLSLCLKIGLFQCLALVPGVSRSGATVAGALLMGADKRSAAEFSFYLAMPTMAGAFAYDLYKNIGVLDLSDAGYIATGFLAAFLCAMLVVRALLDFVSRHGFAPFAWWRIGVGVAGLIHFGF